ncbi:unnamed protein product [Fusarium fujikuroi]|uniref:Uncharacterized protein n=1 Tax=Fusarium fujikuroi TaxID=5127 RepID=A0A9Q9RJZ6_FUSFU|nr:unnamed protein product [Fusarium fujikuroi]VTT66760.1 unnamed protein product [Fusarium fujikuroi]VZI18063.1 unnamed protein product [Fusarium fujikuroi]
MFYAAAAVTNFRHRCRASTSALLLRAAAPHYHPRKSHFLVMTIMALGKDATASKKLGVQNYLVVVISTCTQAVRDVPIRGSRWHTINV